MRGYKNCIDKLRHLGSFFRLYKAEGFQLEELNIKNGIGCNEFVFIKMN
jgi:hypothetical protein